MRQRPARVRHRPNALATVPPLSYADKQRRRRRRFWRSARRPRKRVAEGGAHEGQKLEAWRATATRSTTQDRDVGIDIANGLANSTAHAHTAPERRYMPKWRGRHAWRPQRSRWALLLPQPLEARQPTAAPRRALRPMSSRPRKRASGS